MNDKPRIAYVGMTHLGLCSAVAAASKGFATLGVDPDPTLIASLEAGRLPVVEPELDDLLDRNRGHISFVSDPARLKDCDVIYVASDVPTDDQGGSDLTTLDALLKFALDNAGPDSVVVVLSQVPPGYTRARLRPDKNLYYQVETLVFGRAVERAALPERYMVGLPDPGTPLPASLRSYLEAFDCSDPADAAGERRARQNLRSTAALSLRSRSLPRWRNCASASVRIGRRSRRRSSSIVASAPIRICRRGSASPVEISSATSRP